MNNFLSRLALKGKTLRLVAALTATAALGGCASTISAISIPSNTAWRTFATGITSPYSDLIVNPTGTNITATVGVEDKFILCNSSAGKYSASGTGDPSTWNTTYQLSQCLSAAPTGATGISSLGVFYAYAISATIADAFTTGGIAVESASAGPLFGIALTKSTTAGGPLAISAGVSPVVLAGTWNAGSGFAFQSSSLFMVPSEPSFGTAGRCADGTILTSISSSCPNGAPAVLGCVKNLEGAPIDIVFFSNSSPPSYSLTCGAIPISVTLNSSYTSLGACVDANIKRACTGLTGKNRSSCNNAQTGACQATFNVPSALNPNR